MSFLSFSPENSSDEDEHHSALADAMPDFIKLGLFMPEGVDAAAVAETAKEKAEETKLAHGSGKQIEPTNHDAAHCANPGCSLDTWHVKLYRTLL